MKAIIARTDGTREVVEVNQSGLLEYAQSVVDGWIEFVSIRTPDLNVSLIVNENGFAEGLALNPLASALYAEIGGNSPIVGDALILGGTNFAGDQLGLSDEQVDFLMNAVVHSEV